MLQTVIYYLKDEKGLTLLDEDGDPYLYDVYEHAIHAARLRVTYHQMDTIHIWKHGSTEPTALYTHDVQVFKEWDGAVDDEDGHLLHLDGEG